MANCTHETSHACISFGKKMKNPYDMNIYRVTPKHFKDARLYDSELINDDDTTWTVPRRYYNKKYREWIKSVRKERGNELFRKIMIEVEIVQQDSEGNYHSVTKSVPLHPVIRKVSHNRPYYYPQSKEKGVGIDSMEFVPKMFTEKMGREISSLRNNVGLSQTELAKKLNVDVSMIRNIEAGNHVAFNPQDRLVTTLASVLKVPSIKYQE